MSIPIPSHPKSWKLAIKASCPTWLVGHQMLDELAKNQHIEKLLNNGFQPKERPCKRNDRAVKKSGRYRPDDR